MSIQSIAQRFNSIFPTTPTSNYGQTPVVGTNTVSPLAAGDTFDVVSTVAKGAGGGFAAYKFNGSVAANYKTTLDAIHNGSGIGNTFHAVASGTKEFAKIGFKAAGIGALASGGIAAAMNGYQFATGKISGAEAAGNIAAETVSGAVSSIGAVAVGGTVTALAGKFLSGLPLGILGIGAGVVGAVAADYAFKKIGAYDSLKSAFAN